VGDQHDLVRVEARDNRLGEVGLAEQRVDVVARLLGQPEAEEVEADRAQPGQQLQQMTPVVGARRVAVQEQDRRAASALLAQEQSAAVDVGELP
jgi:hypothetical protein